MSDLIDLELTFMTLLRSSKWTHISRLSKDFQVDKDIFDTTYDVDEGRRTNL